jgi:transposase-like protein
MTQDKNNGNGHPNPEVKPTDVRRHFSAEEKLRILEEVEACEHGEAGAVLRRHGIYSSYLTRWRRARDRGELDGLGGKKRGPKRGVPQELAQEHATLRRENERLRARLEKAETIIEVQKKLCELLGVETAESKAIGLE